MGEFMNFKKFTAVVLCVSQLSLTLAASADTPKPSSEFILLKTAIALQGADLSQQDAVARLGSALTLYDQTAEKTGQIERLQQAMVDLGVYTPDQASDFVTGAQLAVSSGADLPTILSQTMTHAPAGAQFSGCILGGVLLAGVSLIVTFMGMLAVGLATDAGNAASVRSDAILGGGLGGLGGGAALIVAGAYGKC